MSIDSYRWTSVACPLCAELHEGVETIRQFQAKAEPVVKNKPKVSVTSLMAAMAAELVSVVGKRCIIVLDAYAEASKTCMNCGEKLTPKRQ